MERLGQGVDYGVSRHRQAIISVLGVQLHLFPSSSSENSKPVNVLSLFIPFIRAQIVILLLAGNFDRLLKAHHES